MQDIVAAADETATTILLLDAETALGTTTKSGSGSLGPFGAGYTVAVNFSGGTIDLTPPNVIGITDCNLHYSVSLSFSLDLNSFLPHFCLPQVCLFGICTPKICISWPTITVPFSFADIVKFTALRFDLADRRGDRRRSTASVWSGNRRHTGGAGSCTQLSSAAYPIRRTVPGGGCRCHRRDHRCSGSHRLFGDHHHTVRQRADFQHLQATEIFPGASGSVADRSGGRRPDYCARRCGAGNGQRRVGYHGGHCGLREENNEHSG